MEIERKYLVAKLPDQLETYPCRLLEQGYLNTNPVVRIRRDNETWHEDKYQFINGSDSCYDIFRKK